MISFQKLEFVRPASPKNMERAIYFTGDRRGMLDPDLVGISAVL
jgi:hypothetical protein